MARPAAIVAALKSVPGRQASYSAMPSGMGKINPDLFYGSAYNMGSNVAFLDRPASVFSDGAFAPAPPIQPVPVDQPPLGGRFPDPRYWQYKPSWNLPTPPGAEGLKLASFDQLRTLAQKYSVARAALELRIEEIRGLEWDITLTTDAAKAYQGDRVATRDFAERKAKAKRFFRRPDPDFWNFDTFLNAFLEEIFVYDALSVIFRPKFGEKFGMGGRGLLGSGLDSLNLVSGPTIRPLIDLHGAIPRPPFPAYQQYLFGVPRSDYMTIATGADIDEAGLAGAEVNDFSADIMLYAPYWRTRESPYGFPPIERALLPIVSGLQKQEFQLDYFTEGSVPSVYISPGDPNITPTQIGELQNALNAIAGDPSYHLKVIVLPPGSKVDPQRPVDLSDSFDYLVMNQVCMAFDVQPQELGIVPDVGSTSVGPSASGIKFAGQEKRSIKSRTSAKPLLKWICDIFNYVLQDICQQPDMQFQFEGLADEEDKQVTTSLGVEQIQNGISSIDEIRERLDLPPWGLPETSEPIVITQNGPIPFSQAPKLIEAMLKQGQQQGGSSSSSSSSKKKSPAKPRKGTSTTKPNGTHNPPVSPSRPDPGNTPAHAAAQATLNTLRPQRGRTGGTAGRSQNAGSRKRGEGMAPTRGRLRNKAIESEMDSLRRHLGKGRLISTWEPRHISDKILGMVAEDMAKGILIDIAVNRATNVALKDARDAEAEDWRRYFEGNQPHMGFVGGAGGGNFEDPDEMEARRHRHEDDDDESDDDDGDSDKSAVGPMASATRLDIEKSTAQWPGWQHDLGLVGGYVEVISQAFQDAEIRGANLRKEAASGRMPVSSNVLLGLISDEVRSVFTSTMTELWTKAWHLGYESANELMGTKGSNDAALQAFLGTEGVHWVEQVSRTGLGNSNARSELIARTEVARAMNAAAIQCYRDNGVQHKHLLVSPDDTCDICITAKSVDIIPLDSIFPKGGLGGPFHPSCVIGSTRVSASSPIRGATVRDFVGEFVIIETASGNKLTVTPNHPVGTPGGWVPAAEIVAGDHVLRSLDPHWEQSSVDPDEDDIPPRIEDIAKAFPVTLAAMPTSAEDFHGDGAGSDVHVVRTDGLLVDDGTVVLGNQVPEDHFGGRDVRRVDAKGLDAPGPVELSFKRHFTATDSGVGSSGEPFTILRGRLGHPGDHGVMTIPRGDLIVEQPVPDYGTADSEGFCERLLALSAEVTADEVVNVQRDLLSTQVYNLETSDGWYIANGIVTHNCRCVPAPAGVNRTPPLSHLGKEFSVQYPHREFIDNGITIHRGELKLKSGQEDKSRLAWILLRAKDEDGKYRFLLQQRSDGTWGMPGGKPYVGEEAWKAALREVTEEIGDIPGVKVAGTFHHVEDDGKTQVYLYLCDVPYFSPRMNGGTPDETQGAAWFKRKEVGKLNLAPKFREDWESGICLKDNAVKIAQNLRNETGEWLILDDPDRHGAGLGARWPYPHRPNMNVPQNNRPGGGQSEGEMGAVEPPNVQHDLSAEPETRIYPRGAEDEDFPRRRRPAPPLTGWQPNGPTEGMEPSGGIASGPGRGAQIIPGGKKGRSTDQGAPVTGVPDMEAPNPEQPHAPRPELPDWDVGLIRWDESRGTNVVEKESGNGVDPLRS